MNIVIPMAGAGRRFLEAGFRTPKMLIDTLSRPMLYWALDSLQPLISGERAIFVCLAGHLRSFPLERVIYDYCPHAQLIALDEPTRGQAETVLAAAPLLEADEALLIYNCDTYTKMEAELLRRAFPYDGIIPVFASRHPCFSYVEADAQGNVLRVKEKEVISSHATAGLYHFTRSDLFVRAAEEALYSGREVEGEAYVAPLYNRLIEAGYAFRIERTEACLPIGTPAQWADFQRKMGRAPGKEGDRQ